MVSAQRPAILSRFCPSAAVPSPAVARTTPWCPLQQPGLRTSTCTQILFYMRFFLVLFYITAGALYMDILKNHLCGQVTASVGFIPELKRVLHMFAIKREHEGLRPGGAEPREAVRIQASFGARRTSDGRTGEGHVADGGSHVTCCHTQATSCLGRPGPACFPFQKGKGNLLWGQLSTRLP